MRPLWRALLLGLASLSAPLLACGPDFPPELLRDRAATLADLPEGMFAFEASRLLTPSDTLRARVVERWNSDTPDPESEGLSPDQWALVQGLRAGGNTGAEPGAGLPEDVRLYTLGAVAWHQGDVANAAVRFSELLALPESERQLRGVWAAYMLGRIAVLDDDMRLATERFAQARALRAAGAADPRDLALESWGAEAAGWLARDEIAKAVHGYAEQAARGYVSGTASLLIVARRLLRQPDALIPHIEDPLVQQLVAAFAYSRKGFYVESRWDDQGNELSPEGPQPPAVGGEIDYIVGAIDHAGLVRYVGADRLAAAAYLHARFDLAERFVGLAEGALADWVRAKLKLRAGDTTGAATLLAAASKAFATDETWLGDNDYESWPTRPHCRVAVDQSVLALSRGEYVKAAEDLFRAGTTYWSDTAYVAERVLSVDELLALTTRLAPAYQTPPKDQAEWEGWFNAGSNTGNLLRHLTARRLLRAGRVAEALPLFDDAEQRKQAEAYAAALGAAGTGSYVQQARKLSEAAHLARQHGLEILGYEGDPDYQVYGGSYDLNDPTTWDDHYNPVYHPRTDRSVVPPHAGPDEAERLRQSVAQPLQRFHYRFVAADLAQQAAKRVPERSQAYAALMCKATAYVVHQSPETATTIYREYLAKGPYVPWGGAFGRGDSYGSACPAPEFERAQAMLDAERRVKLKRMLKYAGPPVLGVLLLGIGVWWWRRRPA